MDDATDVAELTDLLISQQGVASYRCNDGQVFVFTTQTLEKLLAASIEGGGKACVFVKAGVTA